MAFKSTHDLRLVPAYSVAEAAHYLRMPEETLRSWVVGRLYPAGGQSKRSRPLIHLDDPKKQYLSFINLVEAHVLAAIRRHYGVKLPKVRNALDYVRRQFHVEHPLIDQTFQTDGLDLFVERYGELITASQEGQRAMKEIIGVLPQTDRVGPERASHQAFHDDHFARDEEDRAWLSDRRNRHTCHIHLRAIQGRRFGRGSCAGSRLTGRYSLSTGRLA